jgi:hypothetical protein
MAPSSSVIYNLEKDSLATVKFYSNLKEQNILAQQIYV